MAFPTGWSRRQAIAIQSSAVSGSGTLSDFPVLITRDHLDDEVVDPSGSNAAQSDGGDVRFSSDEDGNTQLPCEIVNWEHDSVSAAGDADIEAWVKVDVSGTADTTIYVWYDTASSDSQPAVTDTFGRNAVWSDYEFVYHMNEDPSGTAPQLADSTGNGHDLTSAGSMVTGDLVAGVFGGKAWRFDDASSQYAAKAGSLTLGATDDMSLQCWGKADHAALVGGAVSVFGDATDKIAEICWNSAGANKAAEGIAGKAADLIKSVTEPGTVWTKFDLTVDESASLDKTFYANGAEENSGAQNRTDWPDDITDIAVGARYGVDNDGTLAGFFSGDIDEVRMRMALLSADWIATEFANQDDPATFATAGTPEDAGGGGGAGGERFLLSPPGTRPTGDNVAYQVRPDAA